MSALTLSLYLLLKPVEALSTSVIIQVTALYTGTEDSHTASTPRIRVLLLCSVLGTDDELRVSCLLYP